MLLAFFALQATRRSGPPNPYHAPDLNPQSRALAARHHVLPAPRCCSPSYLRYSRHRLVKILPVSHVENRVSPMLYNPFS